MSGVHLSSQRHKAKDFADMVAPLALLGAVRGVGLINLKRMDHVTRWIDPMHGAADKASSITGSAADMETSMLVYRRAGKIEFLAR